MKSPRKYTIRYNHRGAEYANSKRAALRLVRMEANQHRLRLCYCVDGIYCYRSNAEFYRDQDGSNAYACISEE